MRLAGVHVAIYTNTILATVVYLHVAVQTDRYKQTNQPISSQQISTVERRANQSSFTVMTVTHRAIMRAVTDVAENPEKIRAVLD